MFVLVYKKVISFTMMVGLFLLVTPIVNAQAASEWNATSDNYSSQVIVPMWDYTNYTNTTLTISGSGTAAATGVITGYQNVTTNCTTTLQGGGTV